MYATFEDLKNGIEVIYKKENGSKSNKIEKIVQENIGLLDTYEKVFKIAELTRSQSKKNIGFFQLLTSKFNSNPIAEKLLNQYMYLLLKKAEKTHSLSGFSDSRIYAYNGFLLNTMQAHSKELKALLQATRKTSTDLYLDCRLQTVEEQVTNAQDSQKTIEDYEQSLREALYGMVPDGGG